MPLKGQSPGTNISFAPQTEAGPPGPAWARFQGPAGRIGARRKNQGSTERTRARGIAPQDESGPLQTDQGP